MLPRSSFLTSFPLGYPQNLCISGPHTIRPSECASIGFARRVPAPPWHRAGAPPWCRAGATPRYPVGAPPCSRSPLLALGQGRLRQPTQKPTCPSGLDRCNWRSGLLGRGSVARAYPWLLLTARQRAVRLCLRHREPARYRFDRRVPRDEVARCWDDDPRLHDPLRILGAPTLAVRVLFILQTRRDLRRRRSTGASRPPTRSRWGCW